MATTATRRVKFYVELVIDVSKQHEFEVGDGIVFEHEPLVVRSVEKSGGWSGHPDSLAADLVVRLTERGRFESLRDAIGNRGAA